MFFLFYSDRDLRLYWNIPSISWGKSSGPRGWQSDLRSFLILSLLHMIHCVTTRGHCHPPQLLINTYKCCFHFYFSTESDLDDLNRDIQSPEPELLYYRGPDDQEGLEHQVEGITEGMNVLSWDVSGAQDWYKMCSNMLYSCQSTLLSTRFA